MGQEMGSLSCSEVKKRKEEGKTENIVKAK